MILSKKFIAFIAGAVSLVALFFGATNVDAARMDMVDVSNYNGDMTVANFTDMRTNYGVKAATVLITDGSSFKNAYAAGDIANAQAAGLYVNGYHFSRYTTTAGAIAEADIAAQTAKNAGLPAGAVLVTDLESSSQQYLSKAQNNANNTAFMNEVAKYGYRSDVYTMGSWLGTRVDIQKGWIAEWPYNAYNMNKYPNAHGWQWSSTYNFSGSYGNFDVSQLYDDFFTSYQAPNGYSNVNTSNNSSTTSNSGSTASTGVIRVNDPSSTYVPLMALQADGSMKSVRNRALANNTPWKTDQTRVVNGVTYRRVATNEWVASNYIVG